MTAPAVPANARTIVESALYQDLLRQRDKYRAALTELAMVHQPDAGQFCIECETPYPCVLADYLAEVLDTGSKP